MKSWTRRLGTRITACILLIQIVVMTAMVVFIGSVITNNTRKSTTNNMETVVEERGKIIENYVQEAENTQRCCSLSMKGLTHNRIPEW